MQNKQIDINLLNEVFDTMNKTTESLKQSSDIFRKKLEQTQNLLDSVLDNTNSAIIAMDSKNGVFLKNREAKRLIAELGEFQFNNMLAYSSALGVHDYETEDNKFLRLNVNEIVNENANGFVYLIDDITDLKKFEQEKLRNEKLQLMGEMAANIAHEVRNPLGSIELYASLLSRDLENDPDKKRLSISIIKGVRTINAVISNTLLFTKEIKVNKVESILSDIVDDVVLYLQHVMREKKVKFINKLDEDHKVLCDTDMYKQVIMNIISNAVDASSVGGEITVTSVIENNSTRLIVSDKGSGISDDMLKRLFMPFQTTKAKGTGLGLSIAFKIIKAHDGDIVAESNGENYTKFTVITPLQEDIL